MFEKSIRTGLFDVLGYRQSSYNDYNSNGLLFLTELNFDNPLKEAIHSK